MIPFCLSGFVSDESWEGKYLPFSFEKYFSWPLARSSYPFASRSAENVLNYVAVTLFDSHPVDREKCLQKIVERKKIVRRKLIFTFYQKSTVEHQKKIHWLLMCFFFFFNFWTTGFNILCNLVFTRNSVPFTRFDVLSTSSRTKLTYSVVKIFRINTVFVVIFLAFLPFFVSPSFRYL